jgi:hypothetical protein
MSYADAVTFESWTLVGDEHGGFTLTAVPSRVVAAYCSGELTAWVPIQQTAWEWDGITVSNVDPTTALNIVLHGMPRMVRR